MSKTKNEKTKLPTAIWIVVSICAAASIFTCGIYVYQFGWGVWSKPEEWGQLGDYIGGILNPIVSFSALCVLVYTVRLQLRELSETKDALNNQVIAMEENRVSDIFFKLFKIHNDVIDEVFSSGTTSSTKLRGKEAISKHFHVLSSQYLNLNLLKHYPGKTAAEKYSVSFKSFNIEKKSYNIEKYFHSISILINFLEMAKSKDIDTRFYYKILISSFNEDEATLIFCYFILANQPKVYIERLLKNGIYNSVDRKLVDKILEEIGFPLTKI